MRYWLASRLSSFQYRLSQAIADSINTHALELHDKNYEIHYSAEFRTPDQIQIGNDCVIKARSIINGRSNIRSHGVRLGDDTYIKENCYLDSYGGFIEVGGKCAFGQNTIIHGGGGVSIGTHVIFGANVYIVSSNHNYLSPELPIMLQGDRRQGISIGSNVWLGGNVVVLDGARIGDNCVIAAGSVVRGEVPSNCMISQPRANKTKELYRDHHS